MKTKVQQPFYKSKLALALFLVLALVAIVSPFWLFTSNSTISFGNDDTASNDASTETISDNSNQSGTAGSLTVTKNPVVNESSTQNKVQQSDNKSTKNPSSNDAEKGSLVKPESKESKTASSTNGDKKEDVKPQGKDSANAQDKAPQTSSDGNDSKVKTTEDSAKTDAKADDNARADAKADARADAKVATTSSDAKETSKAPSKSTDSTSPKSSAADKILEGETVKDDKNNVTGAVSNTVLSDEPVDANDALAKKVAAIEKSQTKEQKAAYAQYIAERKAQVDAAVDSIAKSSRIYMPPMLGSRALVVYFAVQNSNTINHVNPHNLNKLTPKDIDGMTAATTLGKKTNINGVQYIAKMIAEKTGAKLYNITTVVNYPSDIQKLYDFAFQEMANKSRPELTDDNPLDLSVYDAIYICYPNWWDDMPSAVYSFFDKYDLSNMTIIPVCIHSGDGVGNTVNSIDTLEPNATVYDSPLIISRGELKDEDVDVIVSDWLLRLSQDFN